MLVNSANHAFASKTKSSYSTAFKMLIKCQDHFGEQFSFPLSERELLLFIGWNIERGLKSSTIKSYLSGLKAIHKAKGLGVLCTDSIFINDILTGRHNLDVSNKVISPNTRLPCTLEILKLLKQEIRLADYPNHDKIVMWASCSLLFYGAMRSNELLCQDEEFFDINSDLLNRMQN